MKINSDLKEKIIRELIIELKEELKEEILNELFNNKCTTNDRISYTDYTCDEANEIMFNTKENAEKVLEDMKEIAEKYAVATLQDLYNLVGIEGSYKDNKVGWSLMDIKTARVVCREKTRWYIRLPKTKNI